VEKITAMVDTLEAKLKKTRDDEKCIKAEIEKVNASLTAEKYTKTTLETQVYVIILVEFHFLPLLYFVVFMSLFGYFLVFSCC
jgi:hypothetical protein